TEGRDPRATRRGRRITREIDVMLVVDSDAHEVSAPAERNVPKCLVRRTLRVARRVHVRMTAGDLEQRRVSRVRDIRRGERPIEVRMVDERDAPLVAHRPDAVGQRGGRAGEIPTRDAALDAQPVDVHLPPSARHRDLLARDQHETWVLKRRVTRGTRELVVIGQGQELVAMSAIPGDGLLWTAPTVAQRRVRVNVALLKMRDLESSTET